MNSESEMFDKLKGSLNLFYDKSELADLKPELIVV